MIRSEVRRFTIVDGMILVAATAVGLVGARSNVIEGRDSLSWDPTWWSYGNLEAGIVSFAVVIPPAAAWTAAVVILRLRSPRPRGRRLARQPGMVAACSAMGAMAVVVALNAMFAGLYRLVRGASIASGNGVLGWCLVYSLILPSILGFVVAASWATLAVGRRWRAEPGWIDRLGRALGVFWIAMIPAMGWVLFYLAFD